MGHELTYSQQLTSAAREEGSERMRVHLSQRSGRERSREDGREAFENLLGFYAVVSDWKARADLEDREGVGPSSAPAVPSRPNPRKRGATGRTAADTE